MEKKPVDRRRHKRFYYKNGGPFAVTGPDPSNLGQVINISLGGFAFQYLDNGKKWLNDFIDFEIFFGKDVVPLHNIKLETVFDTNENCPSTFCSKELRQRGVKFINLTFEQKNLLQQYIDQQMCGKCRAFDSCSEYEIECKSACIYDISFAKAHKFMHVQQAG